MKVGRLKFLGLYALIALAVGVITVIAYIIGALLYDPTWFDKMATEEPNIPLSVIGLYLIVTFIVVAVIQTLLYMARLRDMGWDVLWASYIPLSYLAMLAAFAFPVYGTGITILSSLIGFVFFLLLLFVPGKKVEVA